MASETTPLVSPGGNPPAYFVDGTHRRNSSNSAGSDSFDNTPRIREDEVEEFDNMPSGGVAAEFNSRPVLGRGGGRRNTPPPGAKQQRHMKESSVGGGWLDYVPDSWKAKPDAGFAPSSSGEEKEDAFINAGGIGTLVLPRKVPMKLEPKVYFANERTFLAWLHVVLILAAASLTIITYSTSEDMGSQLYGIVLLPVSVAYIFYALWQYRRRSLMIKHREPGPFIDVVGPTTLTVIIMASITAQFFLKLHSIMYD
eukprot:CAMPEP_0201642784 /NCGR_PEP_ID=MMETSP0493-20130528/26979_1 /ASSEMBLY_ACC=CAM_ASM_000838 /TAXON_ID=420259 /ORGANISM="Thalassiosira gravida, Strain GMp14c1" /LENGTH=254 /DNA_ID=CAMNT_0048117057 /DNA_START=41 /DNA_END=805 /DNA_ORIENTATION=-